MAKTIGQGTAEVVQATGAAGWLPHVGTETNELLATLGIRDSDDRQQILDDALSIMARSVAPTAKVATATGLAVGHIQSGKTSSFTVVAALARDNGYAMVIVIAGTSLPLFRQSDARLRHDLRLDERSDRAWMPISNPTRAEAQRVRGPLRDWREGDTAQTILITVMKNHNHLRNLADLLDMLDLKNIPVLVVDDEADQASLNNLVKRQEMSTTYRVLLEVRSKLRLHTFLQYTATPQAPLLISLIDALSPEFSRVLTPGKSYTGGQEFFLEVPDLVQVIPDSELPIPANNLKEPPLSLLNAMRLFFVGVAAAYVKSDGKMPEGNRSMLIHPSMGVLPHAEFERWVRSTQDLWNHFLALPQMDHDRQDFISDFKVTYSELATTAKDIPPFDEVAKYLYKAVNRTVITLMNSTGVGGTPNIAWKDTYSHILIGGQALDRGFTIEGLTITYMPRSVGVGNADTVQQRARFYGYKRPYIGYCRVFLERNVRDLFRNYIDHEESLRSELMKHGDQPLAEWKRAFLLDTRYSPTRKSVLGFDIFQGDYANKWFRPNAPQLNAEAVASNQRFVAEFVTSVTGWKPDSGHPDRTVEEIHLVTEVPALEALSHLLAPLRMVDAHDSIKFTGLLLQLRTYLEDHPDDRAVVYRMSGGRPRKRTLSGKDGTFNLFQGKNPKNGPVKYPGDEKIRTENVLSIQIHTLSIPGLSYQVPAIAVWVPSKMSVAWLSALPKL
jgi:hypothetical protein